MSSANLMILRNFDDFDKFDDWQIQYRSGLRTQPCGAPVLRNRGDEAHSDHLTSACQKVQDPAAQRSVQSQSLELHNQCGRHHGVKC